MLEVEGLKAGYGSVEILRGIDLSVKEGEIIAVLGSNGVGGASFNTVEFQFTGGQFNGNTLGFDADTDPGTQSASDHVGMSVTVILSDSSVLTGTLAIDPTNSDRSFVDLW